jgi:glyoxylase-like metal-dependent hydrolase (beta-lactamase superfamily II)
MLFRQLFDQVSSTYTYLLADSGEAVLIDPVREHLERDLALLDELGLRLALVLETHVHADHVTAAGLLRERTGARTAASGRGAPCIDQPLVEGVTLRFGARELRVLETPGHTDDSLTFHVAGEAGEPDMLFTGDALLIRGCGRTDFQNGDAGQLYDALTGKLFVMPDDTRVYPGHDYRGLTMSTIGEERRFNKRLANRSREAFVALMAGLGLPRPKLIDEAVPANRACGRSDLPHEA